MAGASVEAGAEAAVEVEAPQPAYMPYANGQWVYTDAGWYFHAATPAEEITSHHGRWSCTASLGWVWVPGAVWAPAWVEFREDDTYVAWTPVPPGVYLSGSVLVAPPVLAMDRYVVVEKSHFLEPAVYMYGHGARHGPHGIAIGAMARVDGVTVRHGAVFVAGPGVAHIEKASGRKVATVKIHTVGAKGEVSYSAGAFSVWSPALVKVEVRAGARGPAVKPKSYVGFKQAKASYKAGGPGVEAKVKVKGEGGPPGGKIEAHAKVKGPKVKAGAPGGGKVGADVKVKGPKVKAGAQGGGKVGADVKVKGPKVKAGAQGGGKKGKGK
jgi:hypothetical protein